MFSSIKKSKTLRSLLAAASFFVAGAPSVTVAAPKTPTKITQVAKPDCTTLIQSYRPLCEQLEGNFPYCYYGKTGAVTAGCGVHIRDFPALDNSVALKLIPKKGNVFLLENKKRLFQMANADWNSVLTKTAFPEVERVEKIKLKDCTGDCPQNTDEFWDGQLFLLPKQTLDKMNEYAIDFYAQKAAELHPNLFQFMPSAQMVIVDLLYNLGTNKYLDQFIRFKKAVRNKDLSKMKDECGTSNFRRDTIRKKLIESASLVNKKGAGLTAQELCRLLRLPEIKKKKASYPGPMQEPVLWRIIDNLTVMNQEAFCSNKDVPKKEFNRGPIKHPVQAAEKKRETPVKKFKKGPIKHPAQFLGNKKNSVPQKKFNRGPIKYPTRSL